MRYEGDIYRPPSEAYSYLLQVTIGCSHNKCTFCSMFKAKQFRVRPVEEVMEDLEAARKYYSRVGRIFLCDGDALCLKTEKIIVILDKIKELFPECERVGIYARSTDVLRKSEEELKELVAHGLGIVYIGAESGSDTVLKLINKGVTRQEIKESVKKCEEAGLPTSVTFISGMGGKDLWKEHAVETGTLIAEMGASYVGLLTLMVNEAAPIYDQIKKGEFKLLSGEEVVEETHLLLECTDLNKARESYGEYWASKDSDIWPAFPRQCVFRSNHASNYVSLRGNLPQDRNRMLTLLERAMEDIGLLKDERFRML
ncbi:MAG: radical SAM protein [Firmicutes bacterium]|nr:radical SAM protein [Bacillota bacterium]